MPNKFELNRPDFQDIPSMIRLLGVSRRAGTYLSLENENMREAGLQPSSREGIWLYIADQSLSDTDYQPTTYQKTILLDIFTVLRRMYKSADDAWDQSPQVREYVMQDPLARVTERLSWEHDGDAQVTDLSLAFKYIHHRLTVYFPSDSAKQKRILDTFETFVKNAAWALIDFEKLKQVKTPGNKECFELYSQTTAGIGLAIGSIVGEVLDANIPVVEYLQQVFKGASLISQIVDDIIDCPLDILDDNSLSVVKTMLIENPKEYEAVKTYADVYRGQISHRLFKQMAPQTEKMVNTLFIGCLDGIPKKVACFLKDFYVALPPFAVSHSDPLNKGWNTDASACMKLEEYIGRRNIETPYKLVDFINLTGQGDVRKCQLGILIDPDKQEPITAVRRVTNIIEQGGQIVLVGGSGYIEASRFNETVSGIAQTIRRDKSACLLIFPGDTEQIPLYSDGITGVLNYSDILGSHDGKSFSQIYPSEERRRVEEIFIERRLRSISTLYVLCGDPNSSVTRVTGILPLDINDLSQKEYLLRTVEKHLRIGTACIYLEGGSGAAVSIPPEVVSVVRQQIRTFSPQTLLFVGGGITSPERIKDYSQYADCIIVGTYFENQGTDRFSEFIQQLN